MAISVEAITKALNELDYSSVTSTSKSKSSSKASTSNSLTKKEIKAKNDALDKLEAYCDKKIVESSMNIFECYKTMLARGWINDVVYHSINQIISILRSIRFNDSLYLDAANEAIINLEKFKIYYLLHVTFAREKPDPYEDIKDAVSMTYKHRCLDALQDKFDDYGITDFGQYEFMLQYYEHDRFLEIMSYVSLISENIEKNKVKGAFTKTSGNLYGLFDSYKKLEFLKSDDGKDFLYIQKRRKEVKNVKKGLGVLKFLCDNLPI